MPHLVQGEDRHSVRWTLPRPMSAKVRRRNSPGPGYLPVQGEDYRRGGQDHRRTGVVAKGEDGERTDWGNWKQTQLGKT